MKTLIKGSKEWNRRPVYVTTEEVGSGSFLEPPFSKTHKFGVVAGVDHGNGYQEYASIDFYLNDKTVPKSAKRQIKIIIGKTTPWPIDHPEIKKWIYEVLGYFKNCFSPDGLNIEDNLIWIPVNGNSYGDKWIHFKRDVNKHLGVMFIRKYYPEYKPSISDFKNSYWGKK